MRDMGDTLAALPPAPTSIVIGGERFDLTPIKVGEVPAFARAVQPVAASLSASPDWLALLAEHGEAVIEALAIASRRPTAWVTGLELDDAVRLAQAVFEVNADFFIRRVLPSVTEAAARIGARMPGPMSSSDSSVPGTPTPTS
jgi:hypothetical protein